MDFIRILRISVERAKKINTELAQKMQINSFSKSELLLISRHINYNTVYKDIGNITIFDIFEFKTIY